jgi:hypothetical protein
VDGGSWQTAPFEADPTDSNSVDYSFNTFLLPGDHKVEVRATDSAGNTISASYATIDLSISGDGGGNWWVILVAVLGGLVVIGALVYLLYWRKRGAKETA